MATNVKGTIKQSDIDYCKERHCTLEVSFETAYAGQVLDNTYPSFKITPDNGYSFKATPRLIWTVLINGVKKSFPMGMSGDSLWLSNNGGFGSYGTLSFDHFEFETVEQLTVITGTLSQTDIDYCNNRGVDLFVDDVAAKPMSLNGSPVFTFKSRKGYVIKAGGGVTFTLINGYNATQPFAIADGGESATFDSGRMVGSDNATFKGFNFETEQVAVEVVGGGHIYLVTSEDIQNVSKQRFQTINTSGQPDYIDYGSYVLGLIQIPVKLPESAVADEETIYLGPLATKVACPAVVSNSVTIPMGTFKWEGDSDVLDYTNCTFILHLPRCESIALDPVYVVGQTLEVLYNIDMFTGQTLITVTSTKGGECVSKSVQLGINVPYSTLGPNSAAVANSNIGMTGFNTVTEAYLEVINFNSPLNKGKFAAIVPDTGALSKASGYIEVSDIELIVNATSSEQDSIKSLLSSGVFINE